MVFSERIAELRNSLLEIGFTDNNIKANYQLDTINEMLESIEKVGEEAWEFLRNFSKSENTNEIANPTARKGFMFCRHPTLTKISRIYNTKPSSESHSGASYALLMRTVEYIATDGFDAFANDVITSAKCDIPNIVATRA